MKKIYKLLFLSIYLVSFAVVNAQNAIDTTWNKQFIKKYTESLISNDSSLYNSLILSKGEFDSIVLSLNATNSNCITDIENTLDIEKLKIQHANAVTYFKNMVELKVGKSYEIAGCADIKGLKFNVTAVCGQQRIVHSRTLTFIYISEDNYKLLFDVQVSDSK